MVAAFDWLQDAALPVIADIAAWCFVGCLLQLPFLFIRRARHGIGGRFTVCAFFIGFVYWLACLVIAYRTAGVIWTVVGTVCLGVGVIPVAFIATAIHGDWSSLIRMVLTGIPFFVCRSLGLLISARA